MGHEVTAVTFHTAFPAAPRAEMDIDLDLDLASLEVLGEYTVDADDDESRLPRGKARSMTGGALRRKTSARTLPVRKTMSELVLLNNQAGLSASASFPPQSTQFAGFLRTTSAREPEDEESNEDDGKKTEVVDHDEYLLQSMERRQRIIQSANDILRRKRLVGVQVGDVCPICLSDDVDAQLTNCGHRIHARCIKRWIESGSQCPVCREVVTGVEDAFDSPPPIVHLELELEKDVTSSYSSEASPDAKAPSSAMAMAPASAPAQQAYEWGWFEDFDMEDDEGASMTSSFLVPARPRRTSMASDVSGRVGAPLMSRVMSTNFEVCRTFPPLDPNIDVPYSESKYEWIRRLPSHRHISANIKIRCFRIVQAKSGSAQYAEYRIELTLDGRNITKWHRYSALHKFVNSLPSMQYQRTRAAWTALSSSARWFNRLELKYLDQRCRLLEDFAHEFLLESSSAHLLGDLIEA